jgi:hypothetical protein
VGALILKPLCSQARGLFFPSSLFGLNNFPCDPGSCFSARKTLFQEHTDLLLDRAKQCFRRAQRGKRLLDANKTKARHAGPVAKTLYLVVP